MILTNWNELSPGQWAIKRSGQIIVIEVFDCEFGRMWREINDQFAYPMRSPPRGFTEACQLTGPLP